MIRLSLTLAAAFALAACAPDAPSRGASEASDSPLRYGQLAFEACALAMPGADPVEAQCTTLEVPENRDQPDGRRIELAIAWIPATGEAAADPVFMIAGGPGQSALETYPALHAAFSDVRRSRHVILVDARGTGGSHPLACEDASGQNAFTDPGLQTPQAAREFAQACRDRLDDDADLRFYATGDHVRDLDAVRAKLGVAKINLLGISYGSRVAQQYARRYPAHVRSLVLDGVVPNSLVLGQEMARNLDDALQRQFARCRDDDACLSNLGDPAKNLAEVGARLKSGELAPVRYRDPVTGEWRSDAPAYDHLAMLLRMYAYQPAAASMLPLLLHEAAQGRYEGLLAQSRMLTGSVSDSIAYGMQLSVTCTEDASELEVDPADADTVLGDALVTYTLAQCEAWPQGERSENFRAPLTGDVPVLAISGEYDPVTPPRYGEQVVEHLPNGRHLVLPGQGHNVIGAGCMPKLFAQFVETTDAAALDAECLQRLRPTPPFAGFYGWEP